MNLAYRLGWIFFTCVGRCYFRVRYHNPEHVPQSGPVILASNHASFIDPPLVGAGLRRPLSYLGRENLFDIPPLGTMLRWVEVVPVNREGGGAVGLRMILDRLLEGKAILLFPEGTRSPDGQIHAARSGIGLTVLKSHAPVVPVRIFGNYEAWNRRHKLPRPYRIEITYGRPLWFHPLREEAARCDKPRLKAIYREVTDAVMDRIRRLEPFTECRRFP